MNKYLISYIALFMYYGHILPAATPIVLPFPQNQQPLPKNQNEINAIQIEMFTILERNDQNSLCLKNHINRAIEQMFTRYNAHCMSELIQFHGHGDCLQFVLQAYLEGIRNFKSEKISQQNAELAKYYND